MQNSRNFCQNMIWCWQHTMWDTLITMGPEECMLFPVRILMTRERDFIGIEKKKRLTARNFSTVWQFLKNLWQSWKKSAGFLWKRGRFLQVKFLISGTPLELWNF